MSDVTSKVQHAMTRVGVSVLLIVSGTELFLEPEAAAQTCSSSASCITADKGSDNATFYVTNSDVNGNGNAINAVVSASIGTGDAIVGIANGNGNGVFGGSEGAGDGVFGSTSSASAAGVEGVNNSLSSGTNNIGVYGHSTNWGGYFVSSGTSATSGGLYAQDTNTNAWAGYFDGNVKVTNSITVASCTGCGTSSDLRLKKNVKPVTNALNQLLQLKGVTYEWIEPAKHGDEVGTQTGFIAQEVEKLFPSWVHEGGDGFKVLNYRETEALEVESIRELKLQNDELRERMKALEAERRPSLAGFTNTAAGLLGLSVIAGAVIIPWRRRATTRA